MKKKLLTTLALLTGVTGIAFSFPQMTKSNADSSGQTYLEDIVLTGAYWSLDTGKYVIDYLNSRYNREYTLIDQDLNDGCGTTTDYIYSYYATTTYYRSAICDIIITNDGSVESFVDDRGITYYGVGGFRADAAVFTDNDVTYYCPYDCNKNAGGDDIFLFYTKDARAGDPITSIGYTDSKNDSNKTYVKNQSGEIIDLNKGAGGDDIFMYFSRESKGTSWYSYYIRDYDLDGDYTCTKFTTTQESKYFTEERLAPLYDKPYGELVGYYYSSSDTQVQVGDKIAGEYYLQAKWKYDITLDMSCVGESNIEYQDVMYFPEVESPSQEGMQFDGWYYQGTDYQAVAGKMLRKGGVIEPRFSSSTPTVFEYFKTYFDEYRTYADINLEQLYDSYLNNKNYFTDAEVIALRAVLFMRDYAINRDDESLEEPTDWNYPVDCIIENEITRSYSSEIYYFELFAYGAKDRHLLVFLRNYQEETCESDVDELMNLAFRCILYQELNKRGYCYTLNSNVVESTRKDLTTFEVSEVSSYFVKNSTYDELINVTDYVDELNTALGKSNFYTVDPTIRNYTEIEYDDAKYNGELRYYLQAKFYLFAQLLAGYHINDSYELEKNIETEVATIRYDVKSSLTEWCNTYLHMEDYTTNQGYCSDSEHHYYETAKENLSLLTEEQINMFVADSDFSDAYARLAQWATINGDYFEIDNGTCVIIKNKIDRLDGILNTNNTSITILTISFSMIALLSFIIIKKKKAHK